MVCFSLVHQGFCALYPKGRPKIDLYKAITNTRFIGTHIAQVNQKYDTVKASGRNFDLLARFAWRLSGTIWLA